MTTMNTTRGRVWYWRKMLPKGPMLAWFVILVLAVPILSFGVAWQQYWIAIVGAVLAAVFQIAAAYRAKVSHFLECFARCNESYAKLNGRLKQPPTAHQSSEDSTGDDGPSDAIIDYFNLCAEEYLMHKMGVIPDFVWNVWRKGIHSYAGRKDIQDAWSKEMGDGCDYYGFDLMQIAVEHSNAHSHECKNSLG